LVLIYGRQMNVAEEIPGVKLSTAIAIESLTPFCVFRRATVIQKRKEGEKF